LAFNIAGYNESLTRQPFTGKDKEVLDDEVSQLFANYAQLANRNHCRILVVLHPYFSEVCNRQYGYNMDVLSNRLGALENVKVLNLMPFYEKQMTDEEEEIQSYYWKTDGHHNGKGYLLMAKGIEAGLDSLKLMK
jgi:hypothetical protein